MAKFKAGDVVEYLRSDMRKKYPGNRFRITAIGENYYLYVPIRVVGGPATNGLENPGRIIDWDIEFQLYIQPPEPLLVEDYIYIWQNSKRAYFGNTLEIRDSDTEKDIDCLAGVKITFTNKYDGNDPEVKATLVYTKP